MKQISLQTAELKIYEHVLPLMANFICRLNFANNSAFCWSRAPLVCLILDHLLWPAFLFSTNVFNAERQQSAATLKNTVFRYIVNRYENTTRSIAKTKNTIRNVF